MTGPPHARKGAPAARRSAPSGPEAGGSARDQAVLRRRRVAGAGILVVVLAGGYLLVSGLGGRAGSVTVAEKYARAYAAQDPAAMYPLLDGDVRERLSLARFVELHREAAATATATRFVAGPVEAVDDTHVDIPVTVRTRVFGLVRGKLRLEFAGDGDNPGVAWTRNLVFPDVPQGAELTRTVELPPRGKLLTRDDQVLAEGDARTPEPDLADVAAQTVGQLGPVPKDRLEELTALGVPTDAKVGISGLERALDSRLLGTPGGTLQAGGRVLAQRTPRQAKAIRTTIAPSVERAAVAALAGRLGGVVALNPRTGELLAFAGIAFSGLQPPGSTFKMITLVGALENDVAKESDSYPIQTAAVLEGVDLQNANGESCGGTLAQSFAKSCNSVFGPLGAQLGGDRLVATAEEFGFNKAPDIPGAATSTIPAGGDIGDDLALGSTAIGQGRVQATALQMASVAATIGLGGRKPHLTVAMDERADNTKLKPVVDPSAARTAGRMMLDVVAYGTGTAAALPGVKVAGKTGTAELESTQDCVPTEDNPESCADQGSITTDTSAWFAAFAPGGSGPKGGAITPKVAVGVLLVRAGAGGDTAAPVARQVLAAALG
ncbi:penicillin-binding transpeptidase domain-containing protein [Paraconexibacter sp. AEG42_29]|uniref:penicillin-binding transpeptidase domain-containing protein n=1 Tax=Paraconexibacter sp. AEG42_29 TaxID=2997339 RepID=UPI00339D9B54